MGTVYWVSRIVFVAAKLGLADRLTEERTEQEYRTLLQKVGFHLTRVVSTDSPVSVVEAVPA